MRLLPYFTITQCFIFSCTLSDHPTRSIRVWSENYHWDCFCLCYYQPNEGSLRRDPDKSKSPAFVPRHCTAPCSPDTCFPTSYYIHRVAIAFPARGVPARCPTRPMPAVLSAHRSEWTTEESGSSVPMPPTTKSWRVRLPAGIGSIADYLRRTTP